jgi:prepilin-type N-terminal cleavage/methylation domain-containing protein
MSNRRFTIRSRARGFTLIELIVVIIVIGILIAICLPAVRTSGEAARRMSCGNNLKQLGLALHAYHDAHSCFPSAMGGTGASETPLAGNANRLSGIVALFPYIGQNVLWDRISKGTEIAGVSYPPMGPAPWVSEFKPWQEVIPTLRCPSGNHEKALFGRTNYALCIGDMTEGIHRPERLRGAFGCGLVSRLADVSDGASNTLALVEIGCANKRSVIGQWAINQPKSMLTNPSLCGQLGKSSTYSDAVPLSALGRGGRWADGAAGYGLVNTILPPNSPSCGVGGIEAVDGIYSGGSLHPKGLQVAFVDGSMRYLAETIDCGDSKRAPVTAEQLSGGVIPSPYGVWGLMGTASGGETPNVE